MSKKKTKKKIRKGGDGYNRITYETFLEHKNTMLILLILDWQQLQWAWLKGFPIERTAEVFIAEVQYYLEFALKPKKAATLVSHLTLGEQDPCISLK